MTARLITRTHFDYLMVLAETTGPSTYNMANNWIRELSEMGLVSLTSAKGRSVTAELTDQGRREVLSFF